MDYTSLMLIALLLLLGGTSYALTPTEAETHRLSEEIARLSQKAAWSGVDRNYEALMALKDADIGARAHLHAAHAAQARGDIDTANVRANRALAASTTDPKTLQEASEWVADFLINFGEVKIELSVAYRGDPILRSRDPVFDPRTRIVLDHVSQQLAEHRIFHGSIPNGRYQIGGQSFDVYGGPVVKVFVKPVKGNRKPTPEP